ncbi:HNH endonuclease [Bacillus licheniformis]|uniref:HNH endonuclease n=1 Tax=Bacillus licheniformis TaxID=1402 RepID=UPI00018C8C94|nr:HNH endonuclease [Bacillus licheniformis]MBW7632583.1 HNH endonuclease [Bacillus licheniformis]MDH3163806.1 HNH endonuclease [Bacillus licheniformis]MED4409599.1 HNH endonuclease [Bacillus licheniformis]QDL80035.1 HNH endonuclease [Bacillus licheniformis]
MSKIKHENIATSSAIRIASIVNEYLYDDDIFSLEDAIDIYDINVVQRMFKPNKKTLLHYFIEMFCDPYEDIDSLHKNLDEEEALKIILPILKEYKQIDNIEGFIFDDFVISERINNDYDQFIKNMQEFITRNNKLIIDHLVHSTFQILFLDRSFLHDFHKKVSEIVKKNIVYLASTYPEHFTVKQRIKRTEYWNTWLEHAIFYRDKGHCVICRTDLTKTLSVTGTVHIDHIIPLELFGSNDSSNLQLLCESCNTSKGARTTETNNMNVPFWNYDYKDKTE